MIMNGEWRSYVFYVCRGKQRRRLWVKPHDPRTPAQLLRRAVFGRVSKMWSHSLELTEEQREQWRREAAKVRSHPRLGQWGWLTGQQHYVGRNCAEVGSRLGMLPETEAKAEGKRQAAEATSQVPQRQRVSRSTWEWYDSAPRVPRECPERRSRAVWTLFRGCEGLRRGIGCAGNGWRRRLGVGWRGAGRPSRCGSGGRERLARE